MSEETLLSTSEEDTDSEDASGRTLNPRAQERCPECNTRGYLILPAYNSRVHVCGKKKKELEACTTCPWCQTCVSLRLAYLETMFKPVPPSRPST
jgi:hypothetical protein